MRLILGVLALIGTINLSAAPAAEGISGHCERHRQETASTSHDQHHGPVQAPEDCPHCPPATCHASASCFAVSAGLVTHASWTTPVGDGTASFTRRGNEFPSRATQPGLPPPRLA